MQDFHLKQSIYTVCYLMRWYSYLLQVNGDFLEATRWVAVVYLHRWHFVELPGPDRTHGLHLCQRDGEGPHLG